MQKTAPNTLKSIRRRRFGHIFSKINKYIFPISTYIKFNSNKELATIKSHTKIFDSYSLLSVSDNKGNILFVNDRFCKTSKYTSQELFGLPYNTINHPETDPALTADMWIKINKGETWQGEVKNLAKDGTEYWVASTVVPVMDDDDKPAKLINMQIDITYQKKVEAELQEVRKNMGTGLLEQMNYAKKVHSALLANEAEIKVTFPDSFLIYKAQKIISGDFYGMYSQKNRTVLVVGDSTGHGVSASYISILALNILNGALKNEAISPVEILQAMHSEILCFTSKKKEIIESADTIICAINHSDLVLNYSSAKMRALIIRNEEITELKKDNYSVGDFYYKSINPTLHSFQLRKNDCLYLFSDGITDQFGGNRDKKLGYSKLKQILISCCNLPMISQRDIINSEIVKWQGNNDQTDDMTILGIQI